MITASTSRLPFGALLFSTWAAPATYCRSVLQRYELSYLRRKRLIIEGAGPINHGAAMMGQRQAPR